MLLDGLHGYFNTLEPGELKLTSRTSKPAQDIQNLRGNKQKL